MVKIPYEQIIEKIKEEKGLIDEEIEQKVRDKMDKLSGLISKEGAAFIIANELGVKLVQASGKVKLKDILTGMRNIETAAKVMRKFPVPEFERNGSKGKVQSMVIADETGETRLTCWHDQVEALTQIAEGDVIKIMNAYVRDNNGNAEVHMNAQSKIVVNPSDVKLGDVKSSVAVSAPGPAPASFANRKMIKELTEADQNVEIFGTIVQVFEPRFYAVCPQCNRKANGTEGVFSCATHGDIEPNYSYVMNVFIDDGSDNVRAVFFKNQAQSLLKKDDSEIVRFRENPTEFEAYKTALLGEQIKILGRVQKNAMFDRLEIISSQVFMDINPDDEIKKLNESFPEAGIKAEERATAGRNREEKARTVERTAVAKDKEQTEADEEIFDDSDDSDNLIENDDARDTGKKSMSRKSVDEELEEDDTPKAGEDEDEDDENDTDPEEESGDGAELKEDLKAEAKKRAADEPEEEDFYKEPPEEPADDDIDEDADDDERAKPKAKETEVSDDEIEDLLGEIENTPSIDDI